MKYKIVEQECNLCKKRFKLMYLSNGTYIYETKPCECKSDFSPLNGPSISEWLERCLYE